ncbi:hypothetical protein [Neobacillus ginsengisoli]|uniref:Uncharacterized protein n=1 Tax=Neobacillus ginsengisoli TaxID=904295 RepID=A0ABT9XVS6_9BACI|nr:hypothetical protein [Neobacillus ginsengisoli]MDQ0199686.1 hypothetical protein [Neobacillus ginsengisoli]
MFIIKGIYFINERICLNELSKEESFSIQAQSIQHYIQAQNIQVVKLNPYQLKDYYTIPHALLYDLKQTKVQLDCLIFHSTEVIEDFIYSYPAKWIILKSYFTEVITLINDHARRVV